MICRRHEATVNELFWRRERTDKVTSGHDLINRSKLFRDLKEPKSQMTCNDSWLRVYRNAFTNR